MVYIQCILSLSFSLLSYAIQYKSFYTYSCASFILLFPHSTTLLQALLLIGKTTGQSSAVARRMKQLLCFGGVRGLVTTMDKFFQIETSSSRLFLERQNLCQVDSSRCAQSDKTVACTRAVSTYFWFGELSRKTVITGEASLTICQFHREDRLTAHL